MKYKIHKTVEVDIPDGLTIRELRSYLEMNTYSGVKRWCRRSGYKYAVEKEKPDRILKYQLAMESAPSGMNREGLARYLGVSKSTATNCAREYGYRCVRDVKAWMRTQEWDKVIWEKPDSLIAKELGPSTERIRQMRVKLGKPPSPYHRMQLTPDFIEYRWGRDRVA